VRLGAQDGQNLQRRIPSSGLKGGNNCTADPGAGNARIAIFATVSTSLLRESISFAERLLADDFRRAPKEIGSCEKSVHCCALCPPGSVADSPRSSRLPPPAWLTRAPSAGFRLRVYPSCLTPKSDHKIRLWPTEFVMPGPVPGFHVLAVSWQERRGWPGQARP